MVTQVIGTSASDSQIFSTEFAPTTRLGLEQRRDISVRALAGSMPISQIARQNHVSRKFVYRQVSKASKALEEVFGSPLEDKAVLFTLPVTKNWIRQLVLAQVLIGHTSFRGVVEIMKAVFDYHNISIGTIHNIVQDAIATARPINDTRDLSGIRVGAHDEIFQAAKPVLVGMDVDSTYCYLLAEEDHRDATTWGVHLLYLAERALRPDYTIADGGSGLRAGQAEAWDNVPCHGDVFHAERELGKLAVYLANRAVSCTSVREKLEQKMNRARKTGRGQKLSKRLSLVRQAEASTIRLADDIGTVADWMKNDILSLAGPELATRRELFDFIVEQLQQREQLCANRIGSVRRMLQRQRDNLLAFAGVLDERFDELARQFQVPADIVQGICELQGMDQNCPAYWQCRQRLREILRHRFYDVETAVRQIMSEIPRASSLVENLNSRLRNYFFLRRYIGNGYLDLLRFFLNHRRYIRSDRPERVGKSPAELLNGVLHPHWLELLGYQRFRQN